MSTVTELESKLADAKAELSKAQKAKKGTANHRQNVASLEAAVNEAKAKASEDKPRGVGRPRKYIDAFYTEKARQAEGGRGRRTETRLRELAAEYGVSIPKGAEHRDIEKLVMEAQAKALEAVREPRPRVAPVRRVSTAKQDAELMAAGALG